MNLDQTWIADIESDALLDAITKIHVLSFGYKMEDQWVINSTNDYEDIKRFFTDPSKVVAMHNGLRFDVPAIEKILNIKVKATVIDTLALAWYVDIGRDRYNLDSYGQLFGVPKPVVEADEWLGLDDESLKIIEYYDGGKV